MSGINPLDQLFKLPSGRRFKLTATANANSDEYLIVTKSDPVVENRTIPVLLRRTVRDISFFSLINNHYIKTFINKEDMEVIKNTISTTELNKYEVLFGSHVNS